VRKHLTISLIHLPSEVYHIPVVKPNNLYVNTLFISLIFVVKMGGGDIMANS